MKWCPHRTGRGDERKGSRVDWKGFGEERGMCFSASEVGLPVDESARPLANGPSAQLVVDDEQPGEWQCDELHLHPRAHQLEHPRQAGDVRCEQDRHRHQHRYVHYSIPQVSHNWQANKLVAFKINSKERWNNTDCKRKVERLKMIDADIFPAKL